MASFAGRLHSFLRPSVPHGDYCIRTDGRFWPTDGRTDADVHVCPADKEPLFIQDVLEDRALVSTRDPLSGAHLTDRPTHVQADMKPL